MQPDRVPNPVPLVVPLGVFHTPPTVGQTLSRVGQNRGTAWDKTPAGRINGRFPWDKKMGQRGTSLSHSPVFAWDKGAASRSP